jgi:hypothetical protein
MTRYCRHDQDLLDEQSYIRTFFAAAAADFELLPRRWVVQRTLA